jgi:hypothetical protein
MSNLVGYLDLHHPVDETNLVKPEKVESEIINILAHKIILAKSLASLVYQTQVSCVGAGEGD